MSTITALTSAPVHISEITEQMLDELKAATTCDKWHSHTSKYLEVITNRGCRRLIACWLMPDGHYDWRVWQSRNGWAAANMTAEIQKVVEPERYAKRVAKKTARKTARNTVSGTVKIGSIFASSFGYDATLWHFYEVVSVSPSGKTVRVMPLKQETAAGNCGPMSWRCRPVPHAFCGSSSQKRVDYNGTPSITMSSYEYAYLMNDSQIGKWHDADNYH